MSIEIVKNIIVEISAYNSFENRALFKDGFPLKGLIGSFKTIFLSIILERLGRPLLVVFSGREEAEKVADELASLVDEEKVGFVPGGEWDVENSVALNPRSAGLQMEVIRDLLSGKLKIVVTSTEGIAQRFPGPNWVKESWVEITEGSGFDLYELVDRLIAFGYIRESLVERPGEISLRGGILDIFPYTGEEPHRVEFFGDRVESMRTFNVSTQRSTGRAEGLFIVPSPSAWEDCSESILSYFSEELFVFLEDPEIILGELDKEHQRGRDSLFRSEELEDLFRRYQTFTHHTLSSPKGVLDFGGKGVRRLGRTSAEIRENLALLCDTHKGVFVFCATLDQKKRIEEFLDLYEYTISGLRVDVGPIRQGFHLPWAGLAVYTDNDLFGRVLRRRTRERFREGVPIRELTSLKKGDFVVHIDHGIGKYQGLEKITVRCAESECLAILYQDGDKLYVPVDRMEQVQKYTGQEGVQPELSKLGSRRWESLKARTRHSIKSIAKDLIVLYSARQALQGFSFSRDTAWQKELEASFQYEETPDQSRAVEEVREDMEKPRPMDRLVCGDVGYGKTEVAIRAAFKAVNDGKQVALLVPTTILAQQHFRTFQERLGRFPVGIEVLSRFRSQKTQKEIVGKLKRGSVDIVIGTHRLLSKDVGFKDLGLLIIDEEQRFGVRHKERLKAFRKTVDVLTLSATPIPRTLHLSMMGIREMSLINTPPKDRVPIITEVSPFEEGIVVEAIQRELSRGGQVFFVHNRIRSIYAVARMIRRLVPEIRLAVAHGRMAERNLEQVMLEFIEGKYDCLVATMIIESGLDMPNVNTLIIHRADRLGLAQLYQLRGRVGRSDRRAYAYLLTPPFHLLTDEAVKRLRTIEEFTELGSGFQIALRDLEIRGAGNLLGVEQSGYMNAVGFDLYTKLVEEAVQELKAEEGGFEESLLPGVVCRIDSDTAAYFPESYIADESQRVNLYRRLSCVQELSEVDAFFEELKDRFGPLPSEAEHLLEIACLRLLGQKRGLKRIVLGDQTLKMFFDEHWVERFASAEHFSQHLRSMIDSFQVPIRFLQEKGFGLRVSIPEQDPVSFTKKLLQRWV